MSKSATKHYVPGLSNSPAKTAERIIRLLDESRAVTYMHTYEHFRRTLNIWQAALHQVKMRPWLEACAGMERGLGPLQQALGLLMEEAMYNYDDVLGSVYMLLGQGEKRLGQYFTPYSVARMMAEIILSDLGPREEDAPPIKILEPTCGSGVMILACAENIETRYPGMILRGDVRFYGVDRDPLCVTMCNINMLLHGIGHVVRLSDDLSEEEQSASPDVAARSPRCVFQPAKIVQGNSLTQDTAELFAQETPWVPVNLVIPPAVTDEKPLGEATAGSQDEAEVQARPDDVEATEQIPVADGGTVQATSFEEAPEGQGLQMGTTEQEGTLVELPETEEESQTNTEGEQKATDFIQEPSEESPLEESCPELPAPLQVTDATVSSKVASEQNEAVMETEVKAASKGLPTDQGDGVARQEVPLGPGCSGRKRRRQEDTGVVQQDFFSLFS